LERGSRSISWSTVRVRRRKSTRSTVRPKHSLCRRPVPAARMISARSGLTPPRPASRPSPIGRGTTLVGSCLGSLIRMHGDDGMTRSATEGLDRRQVPRRLRGWSRAQGAIPPSPTRATSGHHPALGPWEGLGEIRHPALPPTRQRERTGPVRPRRHVRRRGDPGPKDLVAPGLGGVRGTRDQHARDLQLIERGVLKSFMVGCCPTCWMEMTATRCMNTTRVAHLHRRCRWSGSGRVEVALRGVSA